MAMMDLSTLIPSTLMIRINSLTFKELNNNRTFHSANYLYKIFNLSLLSVVTFNTVRFRTKIAVLF